MEDGKTEFRNYKISRLYTCESNHLVYRSRCSLCYMDYTGQTNQTMRKRNLGHRAEIRSGADRLGKHFLRHGLNLDLKTEDISQENVMKYFELTIITVLSQVNPGLRKVWIGWRPNSKKYLMIMEYNKDLNMRSNQKRQNKSYVFYHFRVGRICFINAFINNSGQN